MYRFFLSAWIPLTVAGFLFILSSSANCGAEPETSTDTWTIDSTQEWNAAGEKSDDFKVEQGLLLPTEGKTRFTSKLQKWDQPRQPAQLILH